MWCSSIFFVIVLLLLLLLLLDCIQSRYFSYIWILFGSLSLPYRLFQIGRRCRNKLESFQFVSNILVSNRYEGRKKSIEIGGGYICIVQSVSSDINALFDTTSKFCTTRNSIRHTVLFDVLKFLSYMLSIYIDIGIVSIRCCTLSLCWYTLKVMF